MKRFLPVPAVRVLCAAALVAPFATAAADLRIAVADGPATPTRLQAALFDSADAFATTGVERAIAAQTVWLKDGGAQIVFANLPAGRYAIKMFADENGNGTLDTNLLGMPTERIGFSNDATGTMGPPGFDAAAVRIDADSKSITVHLH